MATILQIFQQDLIRAALTAFAGSVVAFVGLRIYFRQKEYELVKQRYLESSIDLICAELDKVRGVLLHNIAHCLHAAKELRYEKNNFNVESFAQKFLPFPPTNFHTIAHERLRTLSNSNAYLLAYQKAISHQLALNDVVTKEIPYAFKRKLNGELEDNSFDEIAEKIHAQLIDLYEETNTHLTTISSLHDLSSQLERSQLSLKKVQAFSKEKRVLEIVNKFEKFSSEILAIQNLEKEIAEIEKKNNTSKKR